MFLNLVTLRSLGILFNIFHALISRLLPVVPLHLLLLLIVLTLVSLLFITLATLAFLLLPFWTVVLLPSATATSHTLLLIIPSLFLWCILGLGKLPLVCLRPLSLLLPVCAAATASLAPATLTYLMNLPLAILVIVLISAVVVPMIEFAPASIPLLN